MDPWAAVCSSSNKDEQCDKPANVHHSALQVHQSSFKTKAEGIERHVFLKNRGKIRPENQYKHRRMMCTDTRSLEKACEKHQPPSVSSNNTLVVFCSYVTTIPLNHLHSKWYVKLKKMKPPQEGAGAPDMSERRVKTLCGTGRNAPLSEGAPGTPWV